jgi:thermostable 8-oxoguanine DNA glycosylase
MSAKYSFSFDRESFEGTYNSRSEAFAAALKKAATQDDAPTTVFIGERVSADPQATGHAEEIIARMSERARGVWGDEADHYLRNVTREQMRDLDGALEQVILRWLQLHQLKPNFVRITAVSEHQLASPATSTRGPGENNEVHDLGESNYP